MTKQKNQLADWAERALQRQKAVRYGPTYKAAFMKIRGEAPSGGWSFSDYALKLQRNVFAHGYGTHPVVALALYHPAVFEVHDEHILYPNASMHPLASHASFKSSPWPSTRGTVALAESLSAMGQKHPAVFVRHEKAAQRDEEVAGYWQVLPYVGDYLLYLKDSHGPYAVAWDVKSKQGDHAKPWGGNLNRSSHKKKARAELFRDEIYKTYLAELDIRLVRMSGSMLDAQFAANILRMLPIHARPVEGPPSLHAEIIAAFDEALHQGTPPIDVIHHYMTKQISSDTASDLLDQAIWGRRLKVDLFSEITIDRPLPPQTRDPIEVYASHFRRHA